MPREIQRQAKSVFEMNCRIGKAMRLPDPVSFFTEERL